MILCLYNVDTLNICMKEFGSEKITFDKMTTLNICMKEFGLEKIFFDKMTAVRTLTIFP